MTVYTGLLRRQWKWIRNPDCPTSNLAITLQATTIYVWRKLRTTLLHTSMKIVTIPYFWDATWCSLPDSKSNQGVWESSYIHIQSRLSVAHYWTLRVRKTFRNMWPNFTIQMVKQYILYWNGRRTYHKSLKRSIKMRTRINRMRLYKEQALPFKIIKGWSLIS